MFKAHQKVEKAFEQLGRLIIRNRMLALLISLAVTLALAIHIPKLHMDMSMEGFLHENDPSRVLYDDFREQFGNDNVILLAIESDSIFTEKFLRTLKSLHQDLENEVPYLDEVNSLINARNTYGTEDELVVEDLLEGWPREPRDLSEVKRDAETSPLYRNMYLNAAGNITTLVIKPVVSPSKADDDIMAGFSLTEPAINSSINESSQHLSPLEIAEVMASVQNVVERYESKEYTIHVAGWPAVENALVKIMKKDSVKFLLISMSICAVLLFMLFRRPTPVLLALGVVMASFVSTLGFMGWFDIAYKIPSQVLPAFLTVVGVGDSVHILAIFYRNLRAGMSRNDALVKALGHSGLAVLLTSLTTSGGLISFMWAQNAPLADLGLYAAVGIMLAFFYSVFMLPTLIALLPVRPPKDITDNSKLDRVLVSLGHFACRNSGKMIFASLLLAIGAVYGVTQATYSHFPTKWLPSDMEERLATEFVDEKMAGSRNFEIIVDTHKPQGFHDPELLSRFDSLARALETRFPQGRDGIYIGKTLSVVDILKEIHQALNNNVPSAYAIPENERLIPQEFLLFENSGTDDLEDFVNSDFSMARFSIKVPDMDCTSYDTFIGEVTNMFRTELGPDVTVSATGVVGLTSHILSTVKQTQISSLIMAVGVISLLMVLFMGNINIGLIAMLPNLLPILMGVGIMGLTGIPFDNATTMVATITLGVAVDDTIHFMHNFRRSYDASGDVYLAVGESLKTTGRALLFTSLVLIAGFMSYSFATLSTYCYFGALLSFTMLAALVAEFFLAPALLTAVLGKSPSTKSIKEIEQCA